MQRHESRLRVGTLYSGSEMVDGVFRQTRINLTQSYQPGVTLLILSHWYGKRTTVLKVEQNQCITDKGVTTQVKLLENGTGPLVSHLGIFLGGSVPTVSPPVKTQNQTIQVCNDLDIRVADPLSSRDF